jgi:hypothetical protein
MTYGGAEGYSGSLGCFNYVHTLRGSFPHVSGVCSIDGGKVLVYIVLCSVQGTTSSCCQIVVVPLLRFYLYYVLCSNTQQDSENKGSSLEIFCAPQSPLVPTKR